jgi:DNA-binding CsgD family transcriptional regulator/PAS domain-containing protein
MSDAPSGAAVSQLLGAIYDAAADASGARWTAALELVGNAVGARGSVVLAMQGAPRQFSALFTVRVDTAATVAYQTHFVHRDEVLEPAIARSSTGALLVTDDLVRRADLVRTDFYTDWLYPRAEHSGLCSVVFREGPAVALLYLSRHRADGPFTRDDLRLVSLLTPHVRRAAELCARLSTRRVGAPERDGVMDCLADPLIIVDALAHVTFANRAAETLLASTDGLATERSAGERRGRLCASTAASTTALRRLVADAARLSRSSSGRTHADVEAVLGSQGAGGPLVLPRPSGRPALLALVAPLPARVPAGESAFSQLWPVRDEGSAIVSIVELDGARSPTRHGPAIRTYLRSQYGLTDAEVTVALTIVAGDGLDAVAARRRVSITTVRTQARRIYEKSGVSGQVGLAQLVAQLRVPVDVGT